MNKTLAVIIQAFNASKTITKLVKEIYKIILKATVSTKEITAAVRCNKMYGLNSILNEVEETFLTTIMLVIN